MPVVYLVGSNEKIAVDIGELRIYLLKGSWGQFSCKSPVGRTPKSVNSEFRDHSKSTVLNVFQVYQSLP